MNQSLMNFSFTQPEQTARRILTECGLDDPTEYDIGDIILGRGAFYQEKPLKGKEGEIVSFGGRSIVTINSNVQFEEKKRFAAAHELGHYEMHRNLTPLIVDSESDLLSWYKGGVQEIEANEFAAEFLMPSESFYRVCTGKKFSPKLIEELALRFKVSKTAAILRFVRRGRHPICIVYCEDNKMKWWKASFDFRYFLQFERDEHPPTGSVAYEVFTSGKFYTGDEAAQEIWKSDWFNLRDEERDSKFFEYCLYASSYNYTISILWEK